MQQHKFAADFINSVIPPSLSRGVKDDLREELEGHIEDKIKFYAEIGFDDETAEKKAVEEMGDTEEIRKNFYSLYRTSFIPTVIFPIAYAILSFLTLMFGFVYVSVDSGSDPTAITVFLSSIITLSIPLLILRAYRKQNVGFLISIGVTCVLADVLWIFTAGMYQPFLITIAISIPFYSILSLDYWFAFAGSIALNIFYAVLSFVLSKKCTQMTIYRNVPEQKNHRITEKRLLILFSVITVLVTGVFITKYGVLPEGNFMSGVIYDKINNNKSQKCYEHINGNMSYNEVKAYLLDNGYTIIFNSRIKEDAEVDSNGDFAPSDFEEIESYTDDGYKKILFQPEHSSWENLIVVPDTGDKPITFKSIEYGVYNGLIALGTVEKIEPYKFYESYDNLALKMSVSEALNALDTDNSHANSVSTVYRDNKKYEYMSYFSSTSSTPMVTESGYASIGIILVFENDSLIAAQVFASGEDSHYNYETLSEKSMGDIQTMQTISNYATIY